MYIYDFYSNNDYDAFMTNKNSSKRRVLPKELNKYCECLTDKKYDYNPAVGREKELEELMITVLTPEKSGILIGKPGVGKTAILEGLSYRIQEGNVPKSLKDFIVLKTSATIINSGCSLNGMLEKRVLELFDILKDEKDIILFIDEIHLLIGTGSGYERDTSDIANMIKPFITSENIHLIGATTDYEYESFIMSDPAFSRRFSNIQIKEPSNNVLEKILEHTIIKYSKMYKIEIDEGLLQDIVTSLVKYTSIAYRNQDNIQYNPDLAISVISKAFGYARLYDKKQIDKRDFIKAYKTIDTLIGDFKVLNSYKKIKDNKEKIIYADFKNKFLY